MVSSSYQYITTDVSGHVFTLTMNRPEVLNALHPEASHEMADALDGFNDDPELWLAILTGAGERAFSAGNDLKATAAGKGEMGFPATGFGGITHRFDCNKPIIAAVNGLALGGGFEIALAADIIIASDNATFGLPEPKVGLAALGGGIHRLPRLIGVKNAMALLLTGKHIDAQEAHRLGIVQEITKPEDLQSRAQQWAEAISTCSPLSIRATKEAALGGLDRPLEEAVQRNFKAIADLFSSEDFKEGPRAFAEKRKPNWKGR